MNKPQISVIMPVYNAGKYIKAAINSILNQTFTDFEFIIIDDCSEDNSVEIIKSFEDPRIKLYERPRLGISEQLNFGIKNSNAELIARMDADDISLPDRLETQFKYLKGNKDLGLVGCNVSFIDNNDKKIIEKYYPEKNNEIEYMMPILTSVCHAASLTYKSVIIKVGEYTNSYEYAEDQDLFLRMLFSGVKMYNIQKALYCYRIANNLINASKIETQKKSSYKIGKNYLTKIYFNNNNYYDFCFRSALLEYYYGDINYARGLLIQTIKKNPWKFYRVLRYLVISLLGNKVIKRLRKLGIMYKLNVTLQKYVGIDFYIIRS